jgi:hypothetical protein
LRVLPKRRSKRKTQEFRASNLVHSAMGGILSNPNIKPGQVLLLAIAKTVRGFYVFNEINSIMTILLNWKAGAGIFQSV